MSGKAQAKPAAAKKKEDVQADLEQQFILRLPPGTAMALRRDVQSGAMNLKDKLSIELQPDHRHGSVRYGGQVLNAKLLDLPTVIESLKTTDGKTFYKTADICQMLICNTEDESSPDENESPKKKDRDKKYVWNHGITPPLKNVRKRRFRKTLKKKYQEQPDIEKEVKRLFRADNEAISVRWEVVTDEDKNLNESGKQDNVGDGSEGNLPRVDSFELAEHEIFGELSSSDDEDRDVNIVDSGEEDFSRGPSTPGRGVLDNTGDNQDSMSMGDSSLMDSMMTSDMDNAELHTKLQSLKNDIQTIRDKRRSQELQASMVDNNPLKEKIQSRIDELIEEENEKQNEFDILASMLNQS